MEERKQLLSVPLSALAASPFNVRRQPNGQIEELAALIESQGLLHNLVVTEHVSNGRTRRGGSKAATLVRPSEPSQPRRARALGSDRRSRTRVAQAGRRAARARAA